MKFLIAALSAVTLLPASANETTEKRLQTPVVKPEHTTDDAKKLLDRATATYAGASGLSFRTTSMANGEADLATSIIYAGPGKLAAQASYGDNTQRFLLNDDAYHFIFGTSYSKELAPAGGSTELMSQLGSSGARMISLMLSGQDPLQGSLAQYSRSPFEGFHSETRALPPRVVDGDVLSGVQCNSRFVQKARDGRHVYQDQITAWFGGSPIVLRRVQRITKVNGKAITVTEKILDQKLNPDFLDTTFKFDDTGLKPAVKDEGGNEVYWDPQLKVGAVPTSFDTKDLNGKPISLAKYKGKVLLVDFWATWCAPCVASLPELQDVYDKYHSKGLEVVGVSLDEDKKELTSFIKSHKLMWPQIYDGKGFDSPVVKNYGLKAIPFLLIVGRDGKVAALNPRGQVEEAVVAALTAQ